MVVHEELQSELKSYMKPKNKTKKTNDFDRVETLIVAPDVYEMLRCLFNNTPGVCCFPHFVEKIISLGGAASLTDLNDVKEMENLKSCIAEVQKLRQGLPHMPGMQTGSPGLN